MCVCDCIKKHLWRIIAIFFMLTTLSLGLGWGLTDPCEPGPGDQSRALPQVEAIDDYVINPKIVQSGQQFD
jgi:hypothetical protein